MLYYKIDVLKELKEAGYNSTRIRQTGIIGSSSIEKIQRGEMIGIITLERICAALNKQPGAIIGYKPDPGEK